MTRPFLLDLFCGAGGASYGYYKAGFEPVGVDIVDQPDYPFDFIRADALTFDLTGFDAIHASPPCQGETMLRNLHRTIIRERLLHATFDRFEQLDVPWVIENVANSHMPAGHNRICLCGSSFDLKVRRHRYFWSNVPLIGRPCDHEKQGLVVGVYGNSDGDGTSDVQYVKRGPRQVTTTEARKVMGMPWVEQRKGLVNAIPPVYTQFVGDQLMTAFSELAEV